MNFVWLRWIARALVLAWASWWVFFAVAEGASEGGGWKKLAVLTILSGLVFFGSALIPWRWEAVGGLILILEGLLVCAAYPTGFLRANSLATMLFVLAALALPPLAGGLLFLGGWWKEHTLHGA